MKPISYNQEMGNTEKLLWPGAPQGPAWFQGDQNMPPKNMPLWQKDYLEPKAIEKQQTWDELSALPICPKAVCKCPLEDVHLSSRKEGTNFMTREGDGAAQETSVKSPFSPLVPLMLT